MIKGLVKFIVRTMIGLIFWVVINKKKFFHDKPSTRPGIHLWRGAAPIFSSRANDRKIEFRRGINVCDSLEIIIIDAIAWIIKYFTATSLWYFPDFLKIRGINIKTLISRQIQISSHELQEIIKKMDNIKKIKNMIFVGWKKI